MWSVVNANAKSLKNVGEIVCDMCATMLSPGPKNWFSIVGKLFCTNPHCGVGTVVFHESWMKRIVPRRFELKLWSIRTRSSRQRVGGETDDAKQDSIVELHPALAFGGGMIPEFKIV